MQGAVEQPARLARAVVNSAELVAPLAESSAVAQLVVLAAECNAVAALAAVELGAAEQAEHRSAAAFELVAAVVFAPAQAAALEQCVAEEHQLSAAQESGGIVGLRHSAELAALVSDLPAIAGRIDVPPERRCRDRHSRADGTEELVFPVGANSRKCASPDRIGLRLRPENLLDATDEQFPSARH